MCANIICTGFSWFYPWCLLGTCITMFQWFNQVSLHDCMAYVELSDLPYKTDAGYDSVP